MNCTRCGGTIYLDESCKKCGISFEDMIDSVSHEEMLNLLKKLRKMMQNNEDTEIEESLLAVELINSNLLVPTCLTDRGFSVMTASYDKGREFIMAFTDVGKYERYEDTKYQILPWPFRALMELVENGVDGLIINSGSDGCMIDETFIKSYFGKDS